MIQRLYENIIEDHFKHNTQMLILAGPRQVGKTTVAETICHRRKYCAYLLWDDADDRALILSGQKKLGEAKGLSTSRDEKTLVVFDEIHKYPEWKNYLKGFYDKYKNQTNILITGSAQIDTLKKGGDSLMGRYFNLRIHPLSIGECLRTQFTETIIHKPQQLDAKQFEQLSNYGGFPDPFLRSNKRFLQQWSQAREEQLIREDIRDLSRIHDLTRLGVLVTVLKNEAGQLINYSNMGRLTNTTDETIRQWVSLLEGFYFCFRLSPYTKSIPRSLRKNPKLYLWDWSSIREEGKRNENMLACHLLKAVHYWTDCGLGRFELHFIRDKEKREVDFLVTREEEPWMLVECKSSDNSSISPNLHYFHERLQTKHAFQVAMNAPFVNQDCFQYKKPIIVSALTFLSQLV